MTRFERVGKTGFLFHTRSTKLLSRRNYKVRDVMIKCNFNLYMYTYKERMDIIKDVLEIQYLNLLKFHMPNANVGDVCKQLRFEIIFRCPLAVTWSTLESQILDTTLAKFRESKLCLPSFPFLFPHFKYRVFSLSCLTACKKESTYIYISIDVISLRIHVSMLQTNVF